MKLEFEGKEAKLQEDFIENEGRRVPINFYARKCSEDPEAVYYEIELDGTPWARSEDMKRLIIVYALLRNHYDEAKKLLGGAI